MTIDNVIIWVPSDHLFWGDFGGRNRRIARISIQHLLNPVYLTFLFRCSPASSGMVQVSYQYDPRDRLVILIGNGRVTAFQYDALGRRTNAVWPNGTTAAYAYDEANQLLSLVHASAATTIASFVYAYDLGGNRTNMITLEGTNSYGYSYDAIGNRTVYTNNTSVTTYAANELNQYINILPAAIQPVYDSDGNMTYDGKWGYVWDAENRLVAALPVVTNQGSVRLRFAYDYMSRRVGKEVETWTGMEWSNVVTIAFTYDGWNMVRETRSDESKPNYYVWGLDLSGTPQGAGGVGGLLARVRQENIPHPLYYASDANGNITDVLNTNGTLAAHYEYDPFGNIVALSGDLAGINPFRFSSKYWDEEVGVYYYGYRFYSPEMARWINRDPIEERGGLNLYVLAQNTPANTIDPLGLLQDHVSYAVYLSGLGGGIDVDTDTQMKDCCSDDGKMVKNGDIKLELTVKGYAGLGLGISVYTFDFSYKGPSVTVTATAKSESPSCGEPPPCVNISGGAGLSASSSFSVSLFNHFASSVTATAQGDLRLSGQYCFDGSATKIELQLCGSAGMQGSYTWFGQEHEIGSTVEHGCITLATF